MRPKSPKLLERVDPETADRIANRRKIIGTRNRIAHQYDEIDHQIIWESTQVFLPELLLQARTLLEEAEREFVEDVPDDPG